MRISRMLTVSGFSILLLAACGESVPNPFGPSTGLPPLDPIVPTTLSLRGTLTLNGDPLVGVPVLLQGPEGSFCLFDPCGPIADPWRSVTRAETVTAENGSWALTSQVDCHRSGSAGSLWLLFRSSEVPIASWINGVREIRCSEAVQVFDRDINYSPS